MGERKEGKGRASEVLKCRTCGKLFESQRGRYLNSNGSECISCHDKRLPPLDELPRGRDERT